MKAELHQIIGQIADVRLLVIGDFLLDEFLFGEISRVSREAPVLILRYQQTRRCPGGAANTVANAAALGADVFAVGVVGDDEAGESLLQLWPKNVRTEEILRSERHPTTRKTRILAGSFHSYQQQVVRVDHEHPVALSATEEDRLVESVRRLSQSVDALVVSDYSLGVITPRIRAETLRIAREASIPVVVDSRDHPNLFPGATTITPNISEVEAVTGTLTGNRDDQLEALCKKVRGDWSLDALLVTRGKLGMALVQEEGVVHIPRYGEEAVDVTGAGDTVAATYACALAAGAAFEPAARLANCAGGVVVMKKGTATVTCDELDRAVEES